MCPGAYWKTFRDIVPKLADAIEPLLHEVLSNGKLVQRMEVCGETEATTGKVRYWIEDLFPLRSESGNIIGVGASVLEITNFKELESDFAKSIAERKLVESERETLSKALHQIAEGIIISDPDGTITYVNPAFERVSGYYREEVLGQTPRILKSGKQTPELYKALWETLKSGRAWSGRFINRRKDGTLWEEETVISPVFDSDGVLIHYLAVKRDVTKERQDEEALAEQRERIRNILVTVPGVVWEAWGNPGAAAQRINFVSDYVETMLGYTVDEWLSTPNFWLSIVHPDDRVQTAAQAAALFDGCKSGKLEFRWVAKDGRAVWVESQIMTVANTKGRPVGMRGVSVDVTERKTLEEQLRQAQKIEALGQLSGGIAHDFNNLLTVINGYSDLVMMELRTNDPLLPRIQEIKHAGQRAAALTRQLLTFSRKQVVTPQVLNLNSIITHIDRMLQRVIGENVELKTRMEPALGRIRVDSGQMEQVIMNLAVNARDAMPRGGRLLIETGHIEFSVSHSATSGVASPGPYVLLTVSDNGTGMSDKVKAHVFEPFFTTKENGQGTGLGLPVVHGIIRQSGGVIDVDSEVGVGTTFRICLPRISDAVETSAPILEFDHYLRGTETILLAEDDDSVRTLARTVLQKYGYRVVDVRSAEEAVSLVSSQLDAIDLLITDVIMPGIDGRELADRLVQTHPDLKVLYMSGYADKAIVYEDALHQGIHFIQKPFEPESLARRVRERLRIA